MAETHQPGGRPASLLARLRAATRDCHAALDSAFGSLDLSRREGYERFLTAHSIGVLALHGAFRRFVSGELKMPVPDYPAMLREDLAELETNGDGVPSHEGQALHDGQALDAQPGIAYVIAGSRLGLAMIRKHGYWGRTHDLPSRYMEDVQGQAIWKELARWLDAAVLPPADADVQCRAAVAAFETFHAAFHASSRAKAA